jgi:Uncharacterized protein conserved in bacteria
MSKRIKKDEVTFNIEEHIAVLSENDKNDWVKAVDRISWNGRPATLDIRKRNMSKPEIWPSGISLTDEEADRLTDILLDQDYGSIEALEEALRRKKSRFTVLADAVNAFGEDVDNKILKIEIKVGS